MDEYILSWLKEHDKETYDRWIEHQKQNQHYYDFGVPADYPDSCMPAPDFADIYTFDDFLDRVKEGYFIDYDGTGYLAKRNAEGIMMEYFYIFCDVDWLNRNRHDFTHICWYNK